MKLKITYDNGEVRHITDDLSKEQLKSLTRYITDGFGTDADNNNAFDHWNKVEIIK